MFALDDQPRSGEGIAAAPFGMRGSIGLFPGAVGFLFYVGTLG
jgi:hypothetical protein